jgi:hypothetical protein
MLSQPPFIPPQEGGDSKGEALFPKQGVPSIPRAHGNNLVLLWKVGDVTTVWIAV